MSGARRSGGGSPFGPAPSPSSLASVPSVVAEQATQIVTLGPGQTAAATFVFGIPASGTVFLRILGTGNTVSLTFQSSGSSYTLNAGAILTSGALYEFEFIGRVGESFTVTGTSLVEVTAFWRPF